MNAFVGNSFRSRFDKSLHRRSAARSAQMRLIRALFVAGSCLLCVHMHVAGSRADLLISSSGTNSVLRYDSNTGAFIDTLIRPMEA